MGADLCLHLVESRGDIMGEVIKFPNVEKIRKKEMIREIAQDIKYGKEILLFVINNDRDIGDVLYYHNVKDVARLIGLLEMAKTRIKKYYSEGF